MSKKKIAKNIGKRRPNVGSFKKGDPRCHRLGQISKGVLAFRRSLRELLVAEGETTQADAEGKVRLRKVEWLARVVWNNALKGEAWAVEFIAERTEGKVTQPVVADQNIVYRIIYDKTQKAKVDGNASG